MRQTFSPRRTKEKTLAETPHDQDEFFDKKKSRREEKAKDLEENLDALLEEIDGILEENAEEFVKGYVQKNGE